VTSPLPEELPAFPMNRVASDLLCFAIYDAEKMDQFKKEMEAKYSKTNSEEPLLRSGGRGRIRFHGRKS